MPNWLITSPDLERYEVRVGDCDRVHADSVFHGLLDHLHNTILLDMTEADDEWKPQGSQSRASGHPLTMRKET